MQSGGIKQEISLTGDDEVKRQFEAIGDAGKKALGQLSSVVAEQSSSLSLFQAGLSRIGSAFKAFGGATEPIAEGFRHVTEHSEKFKESLEQVADNVLPHWREIAELTFAAAVLEVGHLIEESAQVADDLKNDAAAFGISTDRLQQLSLAAKLAGVDLERFKSGFARLAQTVETEAQSQVKSIKEIGKALLESTDKVGGLVDVFGKWTAEGAKLGPTILRGMTADDHIKALNDQIRKVSADTSLGADEIRSKVQALNNEIAKIGALPKSKMISLGDTTGEVAQQLKGVADLMQGAFKQAGITVSLDDITRGLVRLAGQAGETGVKWRNTFRDFGADLKPQTISEVLDRLDSTVQQKLGRLVPIFERTADGIRKRRLDEIFLDLANKIGAMKNPADQVATAIGIFGSRIGAGLVPVLRDGRKEILEIGEAFTKAGLAFNITDIESGAKLADAIDVMKTAISNAKNLIGLAFAPSLLPLIEAITEAIQNNAGAIRQWAADLAASFKPAIDDFIRLINGANREQLQTQWVRDAATLLNALGAAARYAADGFHLLARAVDVLAAPFNKIFGTDLSGEAIIITAAVFRMVGGFNVLKNAALLLQSAILRLLIPLGTFIVGLLGWPVTIGIVVGALAGWLLSLDSVQQAISDAFDWVTRLGTQVSGQLITALATAGSFLQSSFVAAWNAVSAAMTVTWNWLTKLATDVMGWVTQAWLAFGNLLSNTVAGALSWVQSSIQSVWNWLSFIATDIMGWITDALNGLVSTLTGAVVGAWNSVIGVLQSVIDWFSKVVDAARSAAAAAVGAAAAGPVGDAPTGFARGGSVPGSGRGDRVPALLEPGEFVARLHAVRTIGANVFAAMNAFPERFRNLGSVIAGGARRFSLGGVVDRMTQPIVPVARFAAGGLVAPAAGDGGRSAFTLVLGGKSFRVSAAPDVAESLAREARTRSLLSAGRAPSFVG